MKKSWEKQQDGVMFKNVCNLGHPSMADPNSQAPIGTHVTLLGKNTFYFFSHHPLRKCPKLRGSLHVIPVKISTACCAIAEFPCLLNSFYRQRQSLPLPWPY